jgi:Prolyl oligopeptidase, N-terminal beta-propeller domain
MRANFFLSLVVTAAVLALSDTPLAKSAPDTPKKPVSTEYHGVTVEDPYQWLEADDDSQVKAWSDAQNQQTRKYLDSFPDRAAIEKQLQEWYAKISPSYSSLVSRSATGRIRCGEPGILFAMKFQPPKQQPLLVTLASADDLKSEKVVLDPNVLDTKGTTAIDSPCHFPKVAAKTAHFTFTKLRRAERCRTQLRMSNIPQQAAAQLGTRMAPGFITRAFPGKASGRRLISIFTSRFTFISSARPTQRTHIRLAKTSHESRRLPSQLPATANTFSRL